MNNIKRYEEFVNEGLYDFVNKKMNINDRASLFITSIFGSFCWFGLLLDNVIVKDLFRAIALVSYVPLSLNLIFKVSLKKLYNNLRSIGLLGITNKRFKVIEGLIEKYPDIEEELRNIKLQLIESIKKNNNEQISSCINDIYILSKNLKKREKLSNVFNLTDEEKEIIKKTKIKRKIVDPYDEEKWEDK